MNNLLVISLISSLYSHCFFTIQLTHHFCNIYCLSKLQRSDTNYPPSLASKCNRIKISPYDNTIIWHIFTTHYIDDKSQPHTNQWNHRESCWSQRAQHRVITSSRPHYSIVMISWHTITAVIAYTKYTIHRHWKLWSMFSFVTCNFVKLIARCYY